MSKSNITWKRVSTGYYVALVGGTLVEVSRVNEFGLRWNLIVGGACDDAFGTKRDAQDAATQHPALLE